MQAVEARHSTSAETSRPTFLLTVDEAKAITGIFDDPSVSELEIESMIIAATEHAAGLVDRPLIKRDIVDWFNCWGRLRLTATQIGSAPLTETELVDPVVSYINEDGVVQAVTPDMYIVDRTIRHPTIVFIHDFVTPKVSELYENPIAVAYTFDPALGNSHENILKQAIALLLKAIYDSRTVGGDEFGIPTHTISEARRMLAELSGPAI